MVKSLCIHLGDCKTGSTSLQQTLKQGLAETPGTRLLYPVRGNELNHCALAATLYMPRRRARQDEMFADLAARLRASDADIALVSAEWFEFADPADLQAALRRHLPEHAETARLLAYLRPHAERVPSSFQESVKLGHFDGDLEAFHARALKRGDYLYAPRVRRWRETFGDRYEVRPMVRDRLREGCAVRDCLSWAVQGGPVRLAEEPRSNESLSLEDLAFLRALHRHGRFTPEHARRVARRLGARPAPGGGARLRLHRALAGEIERAYRADAEALDAELFEGAPLTAAFETARARAAEAPPSLEPEAHMDAAELRRLAALAEAMAESLPRRAPPAAPPGKARGPQGRPAPAPAPAPARGPRALLGPAARWLARRRRALSARG
jgi:hypothetical protein